MRFLKTLDYEKQTYMKIAAFAMLLHILYIIIFTILTVKALAIYNIFSALFYLMLAFVIYKGHYKLAVVAVHLEVALFVTICSFFNGMSMGMGMYLLAMASMVYFCPFEHKHVPYIFAAFNALVYITLRVYSNIFLEVTRIALSTAEATFLHVFNACGSFLVIFCASLFTDSAAAHKEKKLREKNKALAAIANYDDLTGLQSRHFFMSRVDKLNPSSYVAVAIGDIDDFKNINDIYGHICGDYVLQTVADIMRKSLNPENVDICRWGGEEFVMLFHDTSFADAFSRLEKFRVRIENHEFIYNDKSFTLTMSFGLVSTLNKKFSLKMLETADRLLYRGKHQGKNITVK